MLCTHWARRFTFESSKTPTTTPQAAGTVEAPPGSGRFIEEVRTRSMDLQGSEKNMRFLIVGLWSIPDTPQRGSQQVCLLL